jgi:hypothetical protein
MRWGMSGFERGEKERPEFATSIEIVSMNSPADGMRFSYFPVIQQKWRIFRSFIAISFFILLVICGILTVAIFKAMTDPNQCTAVISQTTDDRAGFIHGQVYGKPTVKCLDGGWSQVRIGPYYGLNMTFPEFPLGTAIATLMNSILILIFNAIYRVVSVKLNDAENYRTDTEYEDALIIKTFLFEMVNSYGALAYIAFLKQPVIRRLSFVSIYATCPFGSSSLDEGHSCLSELGAQLFSIFVVNLIIKTFSAVGVPFIFRSKVDSDYDDHVEASFDLKERASTEEYGEGSRQRAKSLVELEYDKPVFQPTMGPFRLYAGRNTNCHG